MMGYKNIEFALAQMVELIFWHWFPITKNSLDQLVTIHDLEEEVCEKTINPNIENKYPKLSTLKDDAT
jgi:hypothetical protein